MDSLKNNRFNYLVLFAISLFTLSYYDHSVNPGLDGSYFWAFNYLFNFKPGELYKITFIYGPLAFLHAPAYYGGIIIISCVFQVLMKFMLGHCLLKLSRFLNVDTRLVFLILTICCLTMFSAEAYFGMITILLLLIHYFDPKNQVVLWIAFFTALGYYFKCSAGLTALLFQGIYLVYISAINKKTDWRLWLKFIVSGFLTWLVMGLLLFRGIQPVFDSLVIYYQNIIAFSEASALYNTSENFILLGLCFVSVFSVYFINSDRGFRLFWILSVLFLYTGYTHSIVRMDHSHYMGFLLYLVLIIACCGLFYRLLSRYTFPLLALAFFCYYGNLGNKRGYEDLIINIPNGPKNIANYLFNFKNYKKKCEIRSHSNLKFGNVLDAASLSEIKAGSVDFFPYDLMYVETYKLDNWKPRPYLQSLNMSSYFDKKTADYFSSGEAPTHLIWHAGDFFEYLGDIDNSYLLNNEFHTVLSIFKNYSAVRLINNSLVLKKRERPLQLKINDPGKEVEINSGEWITIPTGKDVLGCSVDYDFNILRSLKKLVYRDDEFFIEYKTSGRAKIRKRIWPGDAKEFVWLDPYITRINDSASYKTITEVRFINTNKTIHSGKLKIRFKTLSFEGHPGKKAIFDWFNGRL